jgi:hypothetical protein
LAPRGTNQPRRSPSFFGGVSRAGIGFRLIFVRVRQRPDLGVHGHTRD